MVWFVCFFLVSRTFFANLRRKGQKPKKKRGGGGGGGGGAFCFVLFAP
eukprot:COSAG06_NODE_63954_length_261_cov_0.487654_1_plen_47_part_01